MTAVKKPAGNSGAPQTCVIDEARKDGWTSATAREPIAAGWQRFALWIKVPLARVYPAGCLLRPWMCRSATSKLGEPEGCRIPAVRIALFAAESAGG